MFPGRLGRLCGWALQGYSHCRDVLRLGTEDTLRLGTAEILGGLALQGYSVGIRGH